MVSRQGELQVKVTSAFPLSAPQRSEIVKTLKEVTQDSVAVEFGEYSALLAGLRISIGPWVLRANLEDELKFFADAIGHESRKQ